MTDDALFDAQAPAAEPDELDGKSAQQRLTIRQRRVLEAGSHPLSIVLGHLPLHAEAAPADDRKADGRRCGNCAFHECWGAHSYPKCSFANGARRSHGSATDCRAWWPACRDHQSAETTKGGTPPAARTQPAQPSRAGTEVSPADGGGTGLTSHQHPAAVAVRGTAAGPAPVSRQGGETSRPGDTGRDLCPLVSPNRGTQP